MTELTIKEARLKLGLTQSQLAKELGFKSNQQITNIETGARPTQPQTLLAVECLLWRKGLMK